MNTEKHTGTAALGQAIRAGTIAKVGSTKRIQELNGMLHGNRPNVDICHHVPRSIPGSTKKRKECPRSCAATRCLPRCTVR